MILQIDYINDGNDLRRMNSEYIADVEEVRFYDDSLTYKKNKSNIDEGFIHEINYSDEGDIFAIYMLNDEGKTLKMIREINSTN